MNLDSLLRLWLPVLAVTTMPLACLTVIVLLALARRRRAVRGSLRAGPVHLAVEIDASPVDGRSDPEAKP